MEDTLVTTTRPANMIVTEAAVHDASLRHAGEWETGLDSHHPLVWILAIWKVVLARGDGTKYGGTDSVKLL